MAVSPYGRPYKSFTAFDFSGGLDVTTSPQRLASIPRYQNRLTLARNVEFTRSGGVTKRRDITTYNTTTLGATVRITGGFQFRHSNGNDYNLCGTTDGRIMRLNTDGTTTELASGLTTGTGIRWYFAQYANLAIIGNRTDAPRSYDGTTLGTLGGSPPSTAGPFAIHGNRVLCWDATQLSRLSFSALNNPEDWTTANDAGSIQVMRQDGSNGIFLLPMASEVLLGKGGTVYRLQGTSPAAGYTVQNLVAAKVSVGGISFQGAAFANNDGYWISGRGIHSVRTAQEFGDLREGFPSDRIELYFLLGTDYTVSLNQLSASVAVYDSQRNLLFFGVDTDNDGQNDTLFMRDVARGAWAVWPSVSCASLWTAFTGTNGVEVFMGGYDGFVRRLNVSASTNAINARFNHITDLRGPNREKALRRLFIYVTEEGNYNLSITTNQDFGNAGGTTYTVSLLGDTATLGGTFVLGTSTLGARSQIVRELSVSGTGEFWELSFFNSAAGQNFTVLGYQALWRERRVLGRAT